MNRKQRRQLASTKFRNKHVEEIKLMEQPKTMMDNPEFKSKYEHLCARLGERQFRIKVLEAEQANDNAELVKLIQEEQKSKPASVEEVAKKFMNDNAGLMQDLAKQEEADKTDALINLIKDDQAVQTNG